MLFSDDFSTWEQTFQDLTQEEAPGAKWALHLDKNIVPDGAALGWRQPQQTVLGRFQCSRYYRSWISAQVTILCHMHQDTWKSQGWVLMRIFGQKCQKCFRSQFENPEFSTENRRIMNYLVNYILQRYYGQSIEESLDEKVLLDGPHNTLNCEACSLNPHGRCSLAHKLRLPRSTSPSPKRPSSSPSKSRSPSPQTGNTDLGNTTFQDLREPRERGPPLLLTLSIAALTLISHSVR